MKNSEEIASAVFLARDAYMVHQRSKNRRMKKAAVIGGTVCILCLTVIGAGYWNTMQHRLPAIQMDPLTEEAADSQKSPAEETETAQQMTAPAISSKMAEDPVVSAPASDDMQTECEAFSAEVQTETIEETTQLPPAIESTPPTSESTPPTSESTAVQTTEEFTKVPQWTEKTISEQFMEFTADVTVYRSKCSRIDNEYIGEKLYDVVVTGFDDYADEIRYADASVYRINGISEGCAVAVRFQGYDTGYVYTNSNYFPETLGELMDALNLAETISFHALTPAQGESITEFDRILLMNLLNDHRDLARVDDDSYHKPLFSVSTSVELLGISNKSLKITEDGWLTMNIMEVGYSFCIGEDTAAELAEKIGVNSDISTETAALHAENTDDLVLE